MHIVRSLALLPLLIAVPVVAQAGPIVAGDTVVLTDGWGTTAGGEFNMFVNGSPQSFVTFCLQRTEFISFNTPYVVGSVTDYADDASGNDPISAETAWLYTQYRNGTLAGYNQGTNISANQLQNAIWYFENEIVLATPDGNQFVKLAKQAIANGYTGIGDVRVVNLFTQNGQKAQDQLILQVPGPASLALAVPGLMAFAVMRRRKAAGSKA